MNRNTFLAFLILVVCAIGAYLLIYYRYDFHTPVQGKSIPISVYIPKDFPQYATYKDFFAKQPGYSLTTNKNADIIISTTKLTGYSTQTSLYQAIYLLTQDFKDMGPNVTTADYQSLMSTGQNIVVDSTLSSVFPTLTSSSNTLSYVQSSSTHYAIIPFSDASNLYQTVTINGVSPLNKTNNLNTYPLQTQYFLDTNLTLTTTIKNFITTNHYTNYDPSKLHTIIMSGTTALGRGEYFKIQQYGTAYPTLYVSSIMKDADITQVSDEVSYVPGCTQQIGTLKFCALPSFLQTLQDAGVNLVELTGNHNNDYGAQYSASSIAMYNAAGIKHFGGGLNATDARKPAIFDLGGTTFAFLGYNEPGPSYAFATPTSSGAAQLNVTDMVSDIKAAKKIADIIFVDVQWENENNQFPSQSQITDSQIAIDAGASVVTGSSGHRPEGMSFYHGGTIFYGLGNLFFDQMENLDTRQNVIVKHTFYGSTLVSTQLIPTLLYDYAQPRPVTGSDAQAIFDEIWQASTNVL